MHMHFFKYNKKRMVSLALLFAMLISLLSPGADVAYATSTTNKVSQSDMNYTTDLLYELLSKNLESYKISITKDQAIEYLKSTGDRLHLLESYDSESGNKYEDNVLSIPILDILKDIVADYNSKGQADLDNQKTADKTAANKKLEDLKKEKESLNKTLTDYNNELTQLKKVLAEYEDKLAKATTDADKTSYKKQVNNYKTKVAAKEKEISDQKAKITAKDKEITDQEAAIKAIDTDESYKFTELSLDENAAFNYSGKTLRSTYTYGSLIYDYIRKKEKVANSMYDTDLETIVKEKVTTKNVKAKFSDIIKAVKQYAADHATEYKNYADTEYVDSFASEHTITYYQYTQEKGRDVPDGTLFIGTYLINANAINDVYYRYAKDSMGVMCQNIMYYKSELDPGKWKDILSASGLSDILPASANVEEASLNKLRITCVIGEDGIPRYPDNLKEADIFNMVEPYDMEAIPELVKLKLMFDAQVVTQDTADLSNRYTADILYRFFNYDGVGENEAMRIVRNRGYRDYVYDHPNKYVDLMKKNPIPMSEKVKQKDFKKYTYITKDEIEYVTGLQDKALHLSTNMPQTLDRYPDHNDAWVDQILAWTEYYGNHAFDGVKSITGEKGRPIIMPFEDMTDSAWERLNWRSDWENPQSYMFIMNGKITTQDQKDFCDKWLSDTYIDMGYDVYTDGKNEWGNWFDYAVWKTGKKSINLSEQLLYGDEFNQKIQNGSIKKIRKIYYANSDTISNLNGYLNYAFYGYTGKTDGNSPAKYKLVYGKKWKDFNNLIFRYMDWYRNIYDIRDDITYNCDNILKNLNTLYQSERDAGRKEEADTLMTLMSKVDATRRAEIYYNLCYNEKNNVVLGPSLMYVLDLLMDGKGKLGQNYTFISGDDDGSYASNDAVITSVEDAVENCQKAYVKYKSMSLNGASDNVLKKREFELSQQVMNSTDKDERSKLLHQLSTLFNVMDGGIVNKVEEKDMINDITPEAEENYAKLIHAGANDDYREVLSIPGVNKATLKSYLELQKDEANTKVVQLQGLIKAYALRCNKPQGVLYINRRLDWAEDQYADLKTEDPFGKYAKESLDEHVKWLKDILKKVQKGTLSGDDFDADDGNVDMKADLLTAYDNNDLDGAQEIKDSDRNDNGGLGGGTGTGDGDSGDIDPNADLGNINNPFQDAIDKITEKIMQDPDGDWDPKPYITALGELGAGNLEDLKASFEARGAGNDVLDAFDDAIKTAREGNLGNTGGDDGGDGGGDDNGKRLTDDDLKNLIEDLFGKAFADLGDDEKAIVVAACTRFGKDYHYDEVSEFGRGVMYQALDEDNGFFYHQFTSDPTSEYVNLAAVDKPRMHTGYRYVKQGRKVTMTQIYNVSQSGSYEFIIGNSIMTNRSGKEFNLDKNVAQMTDEYIRGSLTRNYAYLDEGNATKYLGISCEYVNRSEYAVFLTTKMEIKVSAFYDAIETAVEELEAESE